MNRVITVKIDVVKFVTAAVISGIIYKVGKIHGYAECEQKKKES